MFNWFKRKEVKIISREDIALEEAEKLHSEMLQIIEKLLIHCKIKKEELTNTLQKEPKYNIKYILTNGDIHYSKSFEGYANCTVDKSYNRHQRRGHGELYISYAWLQESYESPYNQAIYALQEHPRYVLLDKELTVEHIISREVIKLEE